MDNISYKELSKVCKEMDNNLKALIQQISTSIEYSYGLDSIVLDDILKYKLDDIVIDNVDEYRAFLKERTDSHVHSVFDNKSDEDILKEMIDVKRSQLTILTSKKDYEDILKEMNDAYKEFNEENRELIKEGRQKRIDDLTNKYEETTDQSDKEKIKSTIETLKSSMNYSFITERLDNIGEDEVDNIVEGFMNKQKGQYVLKRYVNKSKQFGISDDSFKHFINLEETFLDEKYYPLNNLFLFVYMRMIAYSDPKNKRDDLYVHSILTALSNLFYHNFIDKEDEDAFLDVVRYILDKFDKYIDLFREDNETYKNHKKRIKNEENKDNEKRQFIESRIDVLGLDIDKSLDLEELTTKFTDIVTEMENEQIEIFKKSEEKLDNAEIEEDSDVVDLDMNAAYPSSLEE